MGEPGIWCGAVPVLDTGWNIHHIAGMQLLRFPAPLLIIASACGHQQDLSAALCSVMNVPVVPAAGLEGDVPDSHLCGGKHVQIALSCKILRKRVVLFSLGKYA